MKDNSKYLLFIQNIFFLGNIKLEKAVFMVLIAFMIDEYELLTV